MTKAQLFINTDLRNADGTLTENWVSADVNPDVNITVKDKIKDSKDVGKVFAAYTNQFKLPASKTNNRIFKRFANPNIFEGFDPRRKYDAIIKLNGIDFKKGYIKLNSVDLKNNLTASYSVQFFGEITSLKDILSDKKLKDLDHLSNFSYPNNAENVRLGFKSGFDVGLSSGKKEQTYIAISGGSTSGGNVTLQLDGAAGTFTILENLSIAETAIAIALHVNLNEPFYSATIIQQNNVLIWAKEAGVRTNSIFNANSTGIVATLQTTQQGVDPGTGGAEANLIENSQGDFKYSLLSHTRGFEHDNDGFHRILSDEEREANYVVKPGDRLDFTDLKPSMNIQLIFDAIEVKYPTIRFNRDWMFGVNAGARQLSGVNFTSGATSAGNITVTLNGADYAVALPVGDVLSAATAVVDAINSIQGYVAATSQNTAAAILSDSYGAETAISVADTDSTGAVFTFSTIIQGVLSDDREGGSTLKDLYMWLHNRKGYIGYESTTGDVERNEVVRYLNINGRGSDDNEWEYLSGEPDLRKITNTSFFDGPFDFVRQSHIVNVTIPSANITGTGNITIEIKVIDSDTNSLYVKETATFSSSEDVELRADIKFKAYGIKEYSVRVEIVSDSTINTIRPLLALTKVTESMSGNINSLTIEQDTANYGFFENVNTSYSNLPFINPQRLMPDMKIIDFLSDIFKTYNLVAFEERLDDNTYLINIKSLDDYLDSGNQYDITSYVDISETKVSRISPFKLVEYNYAEPKTFLAINQKELTGDDFGNVTFDVNNFTEEGMNSSNSLLFDGKTYKVQPKLEKMMYERLNDVDTKELTPYQWGWFVADNRGDNFPNPTIGRPLLHYVNNINAGSDTITWSDGVVGDSYYNAPSNVDDSGENTTHFNAEFNEYDRDINANSIFNNFHKSYIEGIYSAYAKRFEVKAFLPPAIFSKLALNDTLLIDRVSYIIDSMDININKALTKLNLLRVTDTFKVFEGIPLDEQDAYLSFRVVTTSANETVSLPYASSSTYNGTTSWGDGATSINTYSEREHTYTDAGEYIIKIAGDARTLDFSLINRSAYTEFISFGSESSIDKLDLSSFGSSFDMSSLLDKPTFRAFSSFTMSGTNGVVNLIEQWDMSNVTRLNSAFSGSDFNQGIGGWDVSNVVEMKAMFSNNTTFNQDLTNWNVGIVSTMEGMFNNTNFNRNLSKWNTSNCLSMKQMFQNTDYNGAVERWNVSRVTDMSSMFAGNSTIDRPLGRWNVGNVTTMEGMFYEATSFNQSLSDWNMSNVTSTRIMFNEASSFNQDLSAWDLSSVTSMAGMFYAANAFNQDITSFGFDGITDFTFYLGGPFHSFSPANYSSLLRAVDNAGETNGIFWCPNLKRDSSGSSARASLQFKGWTVTDNGI